MARTGIISAMPVELEGLVKTLGARAADIPGFYKIYEGKVGGGDVVLACSGIGKVNAAACTQKLIDRCAVDAVINMGIAGGIADGLHTLDVVIGSEVLYHDFTPPYLLEKYYPFAGEYRCDERLARIAGEVCASCPEVAHYRPGRVVSGDCFVEGEETRGRIRKLGGACCEMEGAAIGHVCHMNAVPFLIIRTISDLADEGAQMSYDEFEKKAARQSNRIVEGILRRL